MTKIKNAALPKMGVFRTINHAYLYGPIRYQGLAFPSLYTELCIERLKLLLKHGGRTTESYAAPLDAGVAAPGAEERHHIRWCAGGCDIHDQPPQWQKDPKEFLVRICLPDTLHFVTIILILDAVVSLCNYHDPSGAVYESSKHCSLRGVILRKEYFRKGRIESVQIDRNSGGKST